MLRAPRDVCEPISLFPMLIWELVRRLQEREIEKVNAFYLQKEAEVRPFPVLYSCPLVEKPPEVLTRNV